MTDPEPRELYARVHAVRVAAAATTAGTEAIPGAVTERDLAWFRTAAPHEELNGVLFSSAEHIDAGIAAMGNLPALWHSWPGDPEFDIDAALTARGFTWVEDEPVMLASLAPEPHVTRQAPTEPHAHAKGRPHPAHQERAASTSGATISVVDDLPALEAWEGVWTGRPQVPGTRDALERVGLGAGRTVTHLLAMRDGIPVGCGAAVHAGDTVAIEHIVTLAEHRGHGIGTELTAAALACGAAAGARRAILTASPDGAGIYRRLGFTETVLVRRFMRDR